MIRHVGGGGIDNCYECVTQTPAKKKKKKIRTGHSRSRCTHHDARGDCSYYGADAEANYPQGLHEMMYGGNVVKWRWHR